MRFDRVAFTRPWAIACQFTECLALRLCDCTESVALGWARINDNIHSFEQGTELE